MSSTAIIRIGNSHLLPGGRFRFPLVLLILVLFLPCYGCLGRSDAVAKVIEQQSLTNNLEHTNHDEVVRIHRELSSKVLDVVRKRCELLESVHDIESANAVSREWLDNPSTLNRGQASPSIKQKIYIEMNDIEYERLSNDLKAVNESINQQYDSLMERQNKAMRSIRDNPNLSFTATRFLGSSFMDVSRLTEIFTYSIKNSALLIHRYPRELRATVVMNQIMGCEALAAHLKEKSNAKLMGISSVDSFFVIELSPISDLALLSQLIDIGTIQTVNEGHRIIEIRLNENDTTKLAAIREENSRRELDVQRLAKEQVETDKRQRAADQAETYRQQAIAAQEKLDGAFSKIHGYLRRIDSIFSFNDQINLIQREISTSKSTREQIDRAKVQFKAIANEDLTINGEESNWVQKIEVEIERIIKDRKLRVLFSAQFGKEVNATQILRGDAPPGGYSNPASDRNHPDFFAANLLALVSERRFDCSEALTRLKDIDPSEVSDTDLRKEITRAIRDVAVKSKSMDQMIAAECLSKWAGKYSVLFLGEVLRQVQFSKEKIQVINLLSQYPGDESARAICQCVGQRQVNDTACSSLIKMGSVAEDAVLAITPVSDPLQCVSGIRVLGEIGTNKSLPLLQKARTSSNREVVETSREAARKISLRD